MPNLNPMCYTRTKGISVSNSKLIFGGIVESLEAFKKMTGGRIHATLSNYENQAVGTGGFKTLDDYVLETTNEAGEVEYDELLELVRHNPLQDNFSGKVVTITSHVDIMAINTPIIGGPNSWGGYNGEDKILISTAGITKEIFPETRPRLDAIKFLGAHSIGELLLLNCPNQKLPCTMQDLSEITLNVLMQKFAKTGGPIFCPDCKKQMAEMINDYRDYPRVFQI